MEKEREKKRVDWLKKIVCRDKNPKTQLMAIKMMRKERYEV